MHIIYKSNNTFPITLLCIAMATGRWNRPRWKHFQGWSLMAKIIAETYISPKQATCRMNNAWSILSSTTSPQYRLPCEQNTYDILWGISDTADSCGWASSTLPRASRGVYTVKESRMLLFLLWNSPLEGENDASEIGILLGACLLGWYQTPPLEKQIPTRKALPTPQESLTVALQTLLPFPRQEKSAWPVYPCLSICPNLELLKQDSSS